MDWSTSLLVVKILIVQTYVQCVSRNPPKHVTCAMHLLKYMILFKVARLREHVQLNLEQKQWVLFRIKKKYFLNMFSVPFLKNRYDQKR